MHKATNNSFYWDYAVNYTESVIMKLGVEEDVNVGEFGWDDKHAGVSVLLASVRMSKSIDCYHIFIWTIATNAEF